MAQDWFDQNDPTLATGAGALAAGTALPAPGTFVNANGQPVLGPAEPATSGATPDLMTRVQQALAAAGSTDDPQYWFDKISQDPNGQTSAWDYWVGRINQGDGAAAVRNGTAQKFQDYGVPAQAYQSQPFTGDYQQPAVPSYLSTPYVAPTWTGGDFVAPAKPLDLQSEFTMPTAAELQASPGYEARLAAQQQALERSAAAKGTILSGGTQADTARLGQDYASNEYNNFFGQKLATRGQNFGEYQTNFTDALNQYQQKYNQFLDSSNMGLQARQQNQGEFQANVVQPSQTAYQNRYAAYLGENARTLNDYLTNYGINRTGVQDFLNQNNTVAGRGLAAATASRPA